MAQRIFVNVIGFSDVERHALNTVFRLSEERDTMYAPWIASAPEAARMLLIDGTSGEARLALDGPADAGTKLIWVGPDAPGQAWRTFARPLSWPEVVRSMDELFAPPVEVDFDLDAPPRLDIDLDLDADVLAVDTQPPEDPETLKRGLIAAFDGQDRLYLRSKLAQAGVARADEATTAVEVMDKILLTHYEVVVLDFSLPGMSAWMLLKGLRQAPSPIPHIIILKAHPSLNDRARAWFGGVSLLAKPPHPGKLQALLQKV